MYICWFQSHSDASAYRDAGVGACPLDAGGPRLPTARLDHELPHVRYAAAHTRPSVVCEFCGRQFNTDTFEVRVALPSYGLRIGVILGVQGVRVPPLSKSFRRYMRFVIFMTDTWRVKRCIIIIIIIIIIITISIHWEAAAMRPLATRTVAT